MEKAGLPAVLENFPIDAGSCAISPLETGYINDTFLLSEGGNPRYILQRINTAVFSDVDALMNNVRKAAAYLQDMDYKSPVFLETREGKSYTRDRAGRYWRMMTYIDGRSFATPPDIKTASEAGRLLGKFHGLLRTASMDEFHTVLPRFHDLGFREAQWQTACDAATPERLQAAGGEIGFAKAAISRLRELDGRKLPVRICHNDTKLNNMLFASSTGRGLCIVDLDTVMPGYFHYDFGDAVRTVVNPAPEDERDLAKIMFDRSLFEAFVKGFRSHAGFLSGDEIRHMPVGAVLMPFLHGLRALTDYLEGNLYYRVAYEAQNLDRCRSLFRFTELAMDHLGYMEGILQEQLAPGG